MDGISETIRSTKRAIDAKFPGKHLTATTFVMASAAYHGWGSSWSGDVPPWYQDWYEADPDNWYIRQANTDPQLNPNWRLGPVAFNYQQNSPLWSASDLTDAVMPMQYTRDATTWHTEVDLWKSFTSRLGGGFDRLAMGLGWLTETGFPDWQHDPVALVEHIRYGRSIGIQGFVLFTLGAPGIDDHPLIDALTIDSAANGFDAPFKQPTRSWLARSICGNGELEPGETCDDGNMIDGDGCDSNCTRTGCGNGILTSGEQCDNGNASSSDCCSATCHYEIDGSVCDDSNPCTYEDACHSGLCSGDNTPRSGCLSAQRGALEIVNGKRPRLSWKWIRGEATALADFADPPGGYADFQLCIFAETGGPSSHPIALRVPAGGTCSGRPCWKSLGSRGFRFHSRDGSPDGVTRLELRPGPNGKSRIKLKANGTVLAPPVLPLNSEGSITVQLERTAGRCWETVLTPPAKFDSEVRFLDKLR